MKKKKLSQAELDKTKYIPNPNQLSLFPVNLAEGIAIQNILLCVTKEENLKDVEQSTDVKNSKQGWSQEAASAYRNQYFYLNHY